jgi:hypothetical protein
LAEVEAEATPGGHGTWVDAPSAQTTAAYHW